MFMQVQFKKIVYLYTGVASSGMDGVGLDKDWILVRQGVLQGKGDM